MSRRTRRPLMLPGIESLEQRRLLHGGPATEPRAAALRLVEEGLNAAMHQQTQAFQAQVEAARAEARLTPRATHDRTIAARALPVHADRQATLHAEVMPAETVHATKHGHAKHHEAHARAKHAHNRAATPVATTTTSLTAAASGAGFASTTATTSPQTSSPAVGFPTTPIAAPVIASRVTTTGSTSPSVETTSPSATSPASSPATTPPAATPPVVTTTAPEQDLTVGGLLDTKIVPAGIAGPGVAYIITAQPLPANMTFDRTTGELSFRPAPGQDGRYQFTVTTTGAAVNAAVVVPIVVAPPSRPTTELSGTVVDELGLPLAGMPVAVGTSTATTDLLGRFTLTGLPANPGPIAVGGSVATAQTRQALLAPVDQLLGHEIYSDATNVLAQSLILPRISWSAAASFAGAIAAAGGTRRRR